jgi:hypothetical protein
VVYLSQLKLLRTLACKVTGGFLLVVLASCGGGSSNDSGGTTATQLQGLYRASPLTREFMSFVIPTTSGNATWYGWHFVQDNSAHLFKGTIKLGSNGAAQSNSNEILSLSSDNPWTKGSGSVVISQGSLNSFQATLNFITLNNAAVTVLLNATSPANDAYQYNQSSDVLSLTGVNGWTGFWSSAGATVAGTLKFNNDGTLNNLATFVNCNVNDVAPNGLKLTSVTGANYFTLSVTLPFAACSWTPNTSKTLTGIGFIHRLGGTSVLELMLIDPVDGRGIISYRGVKNAD